MRLTFNPDYGQPRSGPPTGRCPNRTACAACVEPTVATCSELCGTCATPCRNTRPVHPSSGNTRTRIVGNHHHRESSTMRRSAILTSAAFMLATLPTGVSAQTGVASCDDFLKKYEASLASKVPAAQRATFQTQFDQTKKAWSDLAKNPSTKAGLEGACKQMSDQMKTAMTAYGCAF